MTEKLIGLGFNLSEAYKIAIEEREREREEREREREREEREREREERRQVREFELKKRGSGKSHINY